MGTSSNQPVVGKGANQATGLGHRKRPAGASKKHSGKSLGAVRLKELPGPASKTALECEQQENVDPQPSAAPPVEPPAKAFEKKSPTTLFQDELARTCTTDKWFDEQLSCSTAKNSNRDLGPSAGARSHRAGDTSPGSNSRLVRQLKSFQDALKRHFESALSEEEFAEYSGALEGTDFTSRLYSTPRKADQNAGISLMDLGLDAINKVGRTINDFADKVDHTVEHWLDSLQSVEELQRFLDLRRGDPDRQDSGQSTSRGSADAVEEVHVPSAGRSNCRNGQRVGCSTQTIGGRAPQQRVKTAEELAQMEEEFRRVQEELQRLNAELSYAANKCSALSEENSLLRLQGSLSPVSPQQPLSPQGEPDPITDLMAKQLETLLNEKARLAQDNARLQRENTTLHDMLSFSFGHEEDESDAADEEGDGTSSSGHLYAYQVVA